MITNTIPAEAGLVLTTSDGAQLFVRAVEWGINGVPYTGVELGEGEYVARGGHIDGDVHTLSIEEAESLGRALLQAASIAKKA